MKVRATLSALRETRWYEYIVRFIVGGLITVAAGLIADKYGLVIGGLFLGFPSIFPATVTLIQTHKERREEEQGVHGAEERRIARRTAGATAVGTALGSAGLVGFALVAWTFAVRLAPWLVLSLAMLVWIIVNAIVWTIGHRLAPRDADAE